MHCILYGNAKNNNTCIVQTSFYKGNYKLQKMQNTEITMKYEVTSQNTKKMLASTLISLMKKKSLSKISISEIVKECQINRKTFYYHFEDIYELLEWHFEQEIYSLVPPILTLDELDTVICISTDYMEKNTYLYNCADDPYFCDKFMNFIIKIVQPVSFDNITQLEQQYNKKLDTDYKHFIADMMAKMTALTIVDYIKHKNNYDMDKMHLYLSDTLNAALKGFFSKI